MNRSTGSAPTSRPWHQRAGRAPGTGCTVDSGKNGRVRTQPCGGPRSAVERMEKGSPMSSRTSLPFVAVALSAALILPAWAGEEGEGTVAVSGFVDVSYSGNLDLGTDTFGLDQVEIDVDRGWSQGALRADVEWEKDGDGFALAAEQGWVSYVPTFAPKLTFTLGKFNAPIGFELLDAPDMYQFSHGLVFTYGLPTNLTGAMFASQVTEDIDLRAYVVNGWDRNDLAAPGPKTIGGRAGYSLGDLGGVGIAAISGRENLEEEGTAYSLERTVIDVDASFTPRPDLLLGGEFAFGSRELGGEDGVEADFTGFLVMAHYDYNAWGGMTVRFDWFDDPDGAYFGFAAGETRTALTLAPTFVLGDGMAALVELRVDASSEDVFVDRDGETKSSTTSAALNLTYEF